MTVASRGASERICPSMPMPSRSQKITNTCELKGTFGFSPSSALKTYARAEQRREAKRSVQMRGTRGRIIVGLSFDLCVKIGRAHV